MAEHQRGKLERQYFSLGQNHFPLGQGAAGCASLIEDLDSVGAQGSPLFQ
jgi:hypothetical protein